MIQPDCSRAVRIWFRVFASRLSSGVLCCTPATAGPSFSEPGDIGGFASGGCSAGVEANTSGSISRVGPFDRMTARSRTFSSSRMFPGQE